MQEAIRHWTGSTTLSSSWRPERASVHAGHWQSLRRVPFIVATVLIVGTHVMLICLQGLLANLPVTICDLKPHQVTEVMRAEWYVLWSVTCLCPKVLVFFEALGYMIASEDRVDKVYLFSYFNLAFLFRALAAIRCVLCCRVHIFPVCFWCANRVTTRRRMDPDEWLCVCA